MLHDSVPVKSNSSKGTKNTGGCLLSAAQLCDGLHWLYPEATASASTQNIVNSVIVQKMHS